MSAEYRALVAGIEQLVAAGRLEAAEPALQRLVQIEPREAHAWGLLGLLRLRRGEPAAAAAALGRAHELDRRNPQYLNLLGVAEAEQGGIDAGVARLGKALRLKPDYAEAHYNLGKLQVKRGDLDAALVAFRRAVAIEPRYPGARYYLGKVLTDLGRCAEAIEVLERAVTDEPANEWCPVQLARALAAVRGTDAALEALASAAARLPGSALVRRTHAHALLAAGRLAQGWDEYRHRAVIGESGRELLPERWPADLAGRSVSVVWEQGLGDILFFLRYAVVAKSRGASVGVQVPAKLVPLLRRVAPFDRVIDERTAPEPSALVAYAGDLPFVLGVDIYTAPFALSAEPSRVLAWRERLAAFGPGPYLGVAWRAGTDFSLGREFGRSLQALAKAVDLGAIGAAVRSWPGTIVSLQREPRAGECDALARAVGRPVLDAAGTSDDLEDALALLAGLDEYAGVSSTNVHLRAGLGLGGHVLVPYPPDWRWGGASDESPWFPGYRVHRQRPGEAWARVLEPLARLLAERAS